MNIRTSNSNIDILTEALIETGLINKYTTEEVNSFQQWKMLGYKVKKGEKATLKLNMWYPTKSNKKENEEKTFFYMKLTALFTIDQVEKI